MPGRGLEPRRVTLGKAQKSCSYALCMHGCTRRFRQTKTSDSNALIFSDALFSTAK